MGVISQEEPPDLVRKKEAAERRKKRVHDTLGIFCPGIVQKATDRNYSFKTKELPRAIGAAALETGNAMRASASEAKEYVREFMLKEPMLESSARSYKSVTFV